MAFVDDLEDRGYVERRPNPDDRRQYALYLSPAGKGVRVVLTVDGPVEGSLPAHIHTGRCKNEPTFANPRIWASLKNVVNGRSVTAVTSTSLKTLRRSRFSINVHDPHTLGVIACGDIPLARR